MSKRRQRAPTVRRAIQDYARTAYQEAILEAAERVFLRVGYHEAKMSDIAAEAGVSVGTLYNYFDSKENVFCTMVERGQNEFDQALGDLDDQGPPLERIDAIFEAALGYVEKRGAMFALFSQLGVLSENDIQRVGGQLAADGYVRFVERLASALAEAATEGRVRSDVPPKTLALMLTGIGNAVLFAWLQDDRCDSLVDRGKVALRVFLEGAQPR